MTADRVHSPAMPVAEAQTELRRHAGTQFDAQIVDVFLLSTSRSGYLRAV